MLDLALNHEEELQKRYRECWFKEKYKYFFNCFSEKLHIEESTWNRMQFVSLNSSGEVIGFIEYTTDRVNNMVDNLILINFSENIVHKNGKGEIDKSDKIKFSKNMITFGMDTHHAFSNIFNKFHIRKIQFFVIIGNPIEATYDAIIKKNGGRIVGTRHAHVKLYDGNYYDEKIYEIFATDYYKKRQMKQLKSDEIEYIK